MDDEERDVMTVPRLVPVDIAILQLSTREPLPLMSIEVWSARWNTDAYDCSDELITCRPEMAEMVEAEERVDAFPTNISDHADTETSESLSRRRMVSPSATGVEGMATVILEVEPDTTTTAAPTCHGPDDGDCSWNVGVGSIRAVVLVVRYL